MPGIPADTFWSPARFARAKQLVAEGLSASQVAADLGCTRNAVIGKLHRAHVAWTPRGLVPHRGPDRKPRKAPILDRVRPKPPPKPIEVGEWASGRTSTGKLVKFARLKSRDCKWPVAGEPGPDMLCCGRARVSDTCPYCAPHLRLGTTRSARNG